MTAKLCAKDCGLKARSRGLCKRHYMQLFTKQRLYGRWESSYVPAQPVRDHVDALREAGVGTMHLARISGVSRSTIRKMLIGDRRRGTAPSKKLAASTAQKLLAVPIPDIPHHIVAPGTKVPAIGTNRRLRALVAFGYTQRELAERIGVLESNFTTLIDGKRDSVLAATAIRVESLFRELQLIPGPSNRARNHAVRRAWFVPMAWDEDTIDNPDAQPEIGNVDNSSFAERYYELRDLGYRHEQIADKFGVQRESLDRQLMRHGLTRTAS